MYGIYIQIVTEVHYSIKYIEALWENAIFDPLMGGPSYPIKIEFNNYVHCNSLLCGTLSNAFTKFMMIKSACVHDSSQCSDSAIPNSLVRVFSDVLVAFLYFDICHNRQSNLAIENPEFSQPVVAGHFQ